ncbi:hypothetical protein Q8W71_26915 [Methylobacterium sp. NEAU 140]|uniref:hypothetical protein n=1 Tax=Methylobacterium sp. NEAU 140 TaxID=3064945 RepID=UPI002736BEAB|nr:hypothetical protein [Methylobacterium sp. NEAU 140]MDP4026263.1 hypothetical protein [Methylobacterium sp. NEAU 140]
MSADPTILVPSNLPAPALVAAAGERAAYHFLEFFTAQIRNPNTRRAYVRAVGAFCAWLDARGLPSIAAVSSTGGRSAMWRRRRCWRPGAR